MAIGDAFLGLLKTKQRHGYELKRVYDERLGQGRALAFGQVYSTLARLTKNGLIEAMGVAPGEGPERKVYAITPAGISAVDRWFAQPEKPDMYLQSTLYAKVVLALLSGLPAADILDAQQHEHLRVMREVTRRKSDGDLTDHLVCDYALFHLEADLRWLELTAARLDELAKEVQR
jgi:DNA-binding PadR family transcriptional regulator